MSTPTPTLSKETLTPLRNGKSSGHHEMLLVIRVRNGVTKHLKDYIVENAADHQHLPLSVTIDGPYGGSALPLLVGYETVLMFSGGSGVTHNLSIFLSLLDGAPTASLIQRVIFIWSVQALAHLRWISAFIEEGFRRAPPHIEVDVRIYVTRGSTEMLVGEGGRPEPKSNGLDKYFAIGPVDRIKVTYGRPDPLELMRDASNMSSGGVFVTTCGPAAMSTAVQKAGSELSDAGAVLQGHKGRRIRVECAKFEI